MNEPLFPLTTPTNMGIYLGIRTGSVPAHRFQYGVASFREIPCANVRALATVKEISAEELAKAESFTAESMLDFYTANPNLA
jgi:hypothetical protein